MYQYLIGCNTQKFQVLIHHPVIAGIGKKSEITNYRPISLLTSPSLKYLKRLFLIDCVIMLIIIIF